MYSYRILLIFCSALLSILLLVSGRRGGRIPIIHLIAHPSSTGLAMFTVSVYCIVPVAAPKKR